MVNPPSGVYLGMFLLKQQDAPGGFVKIDEPNVNITFTKKEGGNGSNFIVSGSGENVNGKFKLEGELDGGAKKMACMKTYEIREDNDDDDDSSDISEDEDEIDPDEVAALQEDIRAVNAGERSTLLKDA